MIVGIDVDGVLANFSSSYARLITEETGIEFPDWTQEEPEEWYWERAAGVSREQEKRVWEKIKSDGTFWMDLKPVNWKVPDFLSNLYTLKDSVYFITDRTGKDPQYQTQTWLMNHGYPRPNVIISRRGKGIACKALSIEVYIDDKKENVEDVWSESPQTKVWLLKKPYNKELWGSERVVDTIEQFWEEVEKCSI